MDVGVRGKEVIVEIDKKFLKEMLSTQISGSEHQGSPVDLKQEFIDSHFLYY